MRPTHSTRERFMPTESEHCSYCDKEILEPHSESCIHCGRLFSDQASTDYGDSISASTSKDVKVAEVTDEDLGYTDQAWLRGGRYDIDPPKDGA